jgi:ribosomal protein S18/ribosomal protein S6
MFLLDSGLAAKDFAAAEALVLDLIHRYGTKVVLSGQWDERKLAYAVKKQRRGTYYLAYFEAEGNAAQSIRNDARLVEGILRCLILRVPDDAEVPTVIEVPKAPLHVEEDPRARDKRRVRKVNPAARCRFSRWGVRYVDWKETQTLSRLCTGQGKMFSRKRSGNTARFQRQFKHAVKYARFMALLPYVTH